MKNRIWAIALLLLPLAAVAQHDDFIGRSDILLSGGGMNYIGDLNNQSVFGRVHPAFSGGLRYRLDKRWALRGEVAYGALSGGNPDCIERRNLSFRTDLFEGVLLGEFSFWPYGFGSTDHNWTLYMFGGVGVFHFNPMAKYSVGEGMEEWVALQPLHTEGQGTLEYPDRRPYKLTEVCFPFGMGAKFLIGKTVSLSVEYGFRKTLTDYIDDVSKTYVGGDLLRESVENGELAATLADRSGEVVPGYVNAPGIKRGDDSLDDWYSYFHVSVGFSLETLMGWMRSKRCRIR